MTSNGGVQHEGRRAARRYCAAPTCGRYARKIAVLRAAVASPLCEGGWPAARYEALRALREGPTGDMRAVHRRGEPSLTKRAARGRCAGECRRLHARLEWRAGRQRTYALQDLRAARSCRDMTQRGRDKGGARRGEHVVPPSRTVRIHNETCITRKMAPSPRILVYHFTPRPARRGSISKPPVIAHHTQHASATPQSTVSAPPARDVPSITDPDRAVLHLHSVKHAKELRTVKHAQKRPRVKIWSTAPRQLRHSGCPPAQRAIAREAREEGSVRGRGASGGAVRSRYAGQRAEAKAPGSQIAYRSAKHDVLGAPAVDRTLFPYLHGRLARLILLRLGSTLLVKYYGHQLCTDSRLSGLVSAAQSPSSIKPIQFYFLIPVDCAPARLLHATWSSILPASLPNRSHWSTCAPRSNLNYMYISPLLPHSSHAPRPTPPSSALLVLFSPAAPRLPRLLTPHTLPDARLSVIRDPGPHPRPPTSSSPLPAIRSCSRSSPTLSLRRFVANAAFAPHSPPRRPQAIQIFIPPVHGILNKVYPNPNPRRLPLVRTHFFTPAAVHSSRSSRPAKSLHPFFADARLVSALDDPRTLAARSSPRPTSSPFNLPSAPPSSSDLQPRG
ncbi:hypothetical protein C8J57DRAFT_1725434 [Mycena rebaudengoi]|nr:hypothetical protein C8J57DRAFT_1725434 [Mycena rebaudengoi]